MTTRYDRMRAAAEALRDLDTHPELRQQLHADAAELEREIEALRRDAERYRWLRDKWHGFEHFRIATINGKQIVSLDGEVDRVIAKENAALAANGEKGT